MVLDLFIYNWDGTITSFMQDDIICLKIRDAWISRHFDLTSLLVTTKGCPPTPYLAHLKPRLVTHRVLQHHLHASACLACCGLMKRFTREAGFSPLHTGHGLRDERRHASCDAASRLPGHGKQGGHGQNW